MVAMIDLLVSSFLGDFIQERSNSVICLVTSNKEGRKDMEGEIGRRLYLMSQHESVLCETTENSHYSRK